MKSWHKSIVTVIVAATVFGGVLAYASAAPVTHAVTSSKASVGAIAAKKKETNKQKLAKALKACKKDKSKSKRKKCEKAARRKYPAAGKPPTTSTTTTTSSTTSSTTSASTGETPEQERTRAKSVTTTPSATSVTDGEVLFSTTCASCHGPKGEGEEFGPDLHEEPRAQSITGVIEQLIEPAETSMPNFDKVYTFAEKEEIADFVAVEITKVAHAE